MHPIQGDMSTDQQETDQRAILQPVFQIRTGFNADLVPDPGFWWPKTEKIAAKAFYFSFD